MNFVVRYGATIGCISSGNSEYSPPGAAADADEDADCAAVPSLEAAPPAAAIPLVPPAELPPLEPPGGWLGLAESAGVGATPWAAAKRSGV